MLKVKLGITFNINELFTVTPDRAEVHCTKHKGNKSNSVFQKLLKFIIHCGSNFWFPLTKLTKYMDKFT